MRKVINVNTNKAFLNTEIVITYDGNQVNLLDLSTQECYKLNKTLRLHLSAGRHKFYCKDLDESFTIDIEDAIKLGGSNIKKEASFISDKSPWIFVTMADRIYGHNRDTKEEFVEYSLTPNKIDLLDSDYFLFTTNNDYSIFNVHNREFVLHFSDIIYSNHSFVIYREANGNSITIFNFKEDCFYMTYTFEEGKEQFTIAENENNETCFYYITDAYLHAFNLKSGIDNIINKIGVRHGTTYIHGDLSNEQNLFCLYNKWLIINKWIYDLKHKKTWSIELPDYYKITNIINKNTDINYKEKAELFLDNNKEIATIHPLISHTINTVDIKDISEENGDIKVSYTTTTHIIDRYIKSKNRYFFTYLNKEITTEIKSTEFYKNTYKVKDKTFDVNRAKGSPIAFSESQNLYITVINHELHLFENSEETIILKDLYDTSIFKNAYFTSDGKNVVLKDNNGCLSSFGLSSFLTESFDIEGITSFKKDSYNGYKPEILFNNTSSLKPVWRDPITLATIDPFEISNLEYISPDGLWRARSDMETTYFNVLTGKYLTAKEYLDLCNEYDFNWNTTEKKSAIINNRKSLYYFNQSKIELLVSNTKLCSCSNKQKVITEEVQKFIANNDTFTELFIEKQYYLLCYNKSENINRRILIGRNVWFLNYVSFSYDSHYVALGAKMQSDIFRTNEEGVFILFDLKEDTVISQNNSPRALNAVWMTLFSKSGDVAYYDSHANAYLITAVSGYKETYEIPGKSLLCFSPSGRYIAFSNQSYVPYNICNNNSWGHQPSGNIYIHSLKAFDIELASYNDFGLGLKGASKSTRAYNVSAAAFSQDEKRLLAIGEDGTVVIRNLHLPEDSENDNTDYIT